MIKVAFCDYGKMKSEIHSVRKSVFIDEQGIDSGLEVDGKDPEALHVLAVDAGVPIGTARIEMNGKVGRVSVIKEYRNRGIGKMIMHEIEHIASLYGIDVVHLHAQKSALKFYLDLGYKVIGEEFVEAGIPHYSMEKKS